jgi:sugar transferase (PEP-CTERM/EpsH1 system associated)
MRNLLFLSHRLPYPPDKGEKIRAWHILRHLTRTHRIHVGCLIDDPADWRHLPFLRSFCAEVGCFEINRSRQRLKALLKLRPGRALTLDYFHDPRLRRWVDETLSTGKIDDIFVFSSSMAPYVMSARARTRLLDMVDVDSEKWAAYANHFRWPRRSIWAREAKTLLAFEREAAAHFDRTFFVSEDELRRFVALAPECADRCGWVENGVDFARFSPDLPFESPFPDSAPSIVFTGTMDYWPNVDAVAWFAREVMPLLRQRPISPQFHIVGANPGREVMRLAEAPDVHVTGRVPDTRPFIAHASVVVTPLRIARGIQNKVLEGMAMAKPVVASPQAFEGVRAQPGRELLVADGAAATARAVSDVLDGAHQELGAAARAAIERSYDWSATLSVLDASFCDKGARQEPPRRTLSQSGVLT